MVRSIKRLLLSSLATATSLLAIAPAQAVTFNLIDTGGTAPGQWKACRIVQPHILQIPFPEGWFSCRSMYMHVRASLEALERSGVRTVASPLPSLEMESRRDKTRTWKLDELPDQQIVRPPRPTAGSGVARCDGCGHNAPPRAVGAAARSNHISASDVPSI